MDIDEMTARIDRQNKEFTALNQLVKSWETLKQIAVVDDDYPRFRHYYERDLDLFLKACKENGR
jgi:hypothetical protein